MNERVRDVKRKLMTALVLNLPSILKFTDEQFESLVRANREMRLELLFATTSAKSVTGYLKNP